MHSNIILLALAIFPKTSFCNFIEIHVYKRCPTHILEEAKALHTKSRSFNALIRKTIKLQKCINFYNDISSKTFFMHWSNVALSRRSLEVFGIALYAGVKCKM